MHKQKLKIKQSSTSPLSVAARAYFKWLLYVSAACLLLYTRFDVVAVSVCILVAVFTNMSSEESESSAYSVFNKGRRIIGDQFSHDVLTTGRG